MHVKDDENGTDEFADGSVSAFCEVSPLERRASIVLPSLCAGGEARGESTVECRLLANNQDVQVTLIAKLYEGTSCSNNDLDGIGEALVASLAPGQQAPVQATAKNGEFASDDYVTTSLTLENVQGSVLDLPIIDSNLRRRIKIEMIDIDVVDHETIGANEIVHDSSLVKYCYVDPLFPRDSERDTTACAGGEVRGRLEWSCSLVPGSNGVVRLGMALSMYEGTTCSEDVPASATASDELIVQPCPPSGCGGLFDGPVSLVASDGANQVRVLVRASNELAP